MKKARYAFAAVGAAPALGLLAPAAPAAAASTHAQAGPAKTVRFSQDTNPALPSGTPSPSPAASPSYSCHPGTVSGGWSEPNHLFQFRIIHYGHCVDAQNGLLEVGQKGLWERIRAYSQYGQLIFWRRVPGNDQGNHVLFPFSDFSTLNWNPVYTICAALVSGESGNTPYFGPVCLHP